MSKFEMWGYPAEVVIKIKMDRATVEIPVSDVTDYITGDYDEMRIPLQGQWLKHADKTVHECQRRGK